MKKSGIYKINFPNGKSYVGMSVDIENRIKEHNNDALKPKYPVHEAIKKYYGKIELFSNVEILEEIDPSNRQLMSEREKYWINYYRTFIDKNKGYNLTPGGDGASTGIYNSSAKLNQDQLELIYDLLLNSEYYIYQIAELFLISPEAISNINLGKTYYNQQLQYPLRDNTRFKKGHYVEKGVNNHLSCFSQEDINNIYILLKSSNLSLNEIAEKYNVSYTTISYINRGLRYQKDNCIYPIRKENKGNMLFDDETLYKVIEDIQNSKISLAKLAQKYSVSKDTIYRINKGENYHQDNLNYPLRKK